MSQQIRSRVQSGLIRLWEEVKSKIRGLSQEGPEIVSASLIGRPVVTRRIDRVMDLDTVIVIRDPMSEDAFRRIQHLFEQLRNLGTPDFEVEYAVKDGPMKPHAERRNVLFLHVLLHSVASYCRSPLRLVKNSWQHEGRTFLGQGLSKVERIRKLASGDLLDGTLGLNHCIRMLETRTSAFLDWQQADDGTMKMTLRPLAVSDDESLLELSYYSALRGASNALRYVIGRSANIGIDEAMTLIFARFFPENAWGRYPKAVLHEKILLRQGLLLPAPSLAESRRLQTLEFLRFLVHEIRLRTILPSTSLSLEKLPAFNA